MGKRLEEACEILFSVALRLDDMPGREMDEDEEAYFAEIVTFLIHRCQYEPAIEMWGDVE